MEETVIPDIRVRVDGKKIILTQEGPVFQLPLVLELATVNGVVRRSFYLDEKEKPLEVRDLAEVTEVRIDPDHHFLLNTERID